MILGTKYKDMQRKLRAYEGHRNRAFQRYISFEFTFDEWCFWWKSHLGPNWINLRGCKKHQYVMARYFDDGPYAPHNVKCITASANCREIQANKWKRYDRLRDFRIKHGLPPVGPIRNRFVLSRHGR